MAPEVIESKSGMSTYGPKTDIWSIGITCIELAETMPPLSHINPMRALFQIPARESPVLEKKQKWSAEFHDFLAKALEKDPKLRPTALELLEHPWMKNCNKDPQILANFVKRKNKLENCYDSDESDSGEFIDEDEMADYLGEDILSPRLNSIDSYSSPYGSTNSNSNLSQTYDAVNAGPVNDNVPKYLAAAAPLPGDLPVQNSTPNLPISQTQRPSYLSNIGTEPVIENKPTTPKVEPVKQDTSSINIEKPAIETKTENPPKKAIASSAPVIKSEKAALPSQKTSTPSKRPGATLKRPPPTNMSTKRSKNNNIGKGGNNNLRERANKRVIKQQMQVLRDLAAKAQKRLLKQNKIQCAEKDKIIEQYKRSMDQIIKNTDKARRTMETQHRQEIDGLTKSQLKQQKLVQKETETTDRSMQKEIRDKAKLSNKNNTARQKQLLKEQKLKIKQSKKGMSSSALKAMKKEQKVEIQLNDMMHSLYLTREQKFTEAKVEWENNEKYDKVIWNQLHDGQKQKTDMAKQLNDLEMDTAIQKFNIRKEELQKIIPIDKKHLLEVHELQINNLQIQLKVEREQQLSLLTSEHKRMAKELKEKKRMIGKQEETRKKQLSRGKNKQQLKNLQMESKSRLSETVKELDDEYEKITQKQLAEEEEDLEIYQKHVLQQLQKQQKDQLLELETRQTKDENDLEQEELETRKLITTDHHAKACALLEANHENQTQLQDKQHENKVTLLRNSHNNLIALVENQRQELLTFLQTKLGGEPNRTFLDRISTEINEVLESRQVIQQKEQVEVSEKLEQEQRDLKKIQFEEKQILEENQRAEMEQLDKIREASVFVLDRKSVV